MNAELAKGPLWLLIAEADFVGCVTVKNNDLPKLNNEIPRFVVLLKFREILPNRIAQRPMASTGINTLDIPLPHISYQAKRLISLTKVSPKTLPSCDFPGLLMYSMRCKSPLIPPST